MGFCLSHMSALEYWRSLDAFDAARLLKVGVTARRAVPSPAENGIVSAVGIEDEILSTAGPLSRPIHISVPSKMQWRRQNAVVFHVCPRLLPRGSFYELKKNAFVVSPELAFIQHSTKASLVDLLAIGAELTGFYSIRKGSFVSDSSCDCGFLRRNALTNLDKMQSFLSQVSGAHGVKRARRVLRFIPEGCASPMEAVLALLLHLPRSLGGYGLPKPLMNHRIDMCKNAWKTTSKPYYVCDLYWPEAKLCVEYDSDMFHTGPQRIASDSSRRNALSYRGVSVVSVTGRQIVVCAEMDRVAHILAKKLGVRLGAFDADFKRRQNALRLELLPRVGRFQDGGGVL